MKFEIFDAWLEKDGKVLLELGSYSAMHRGAAKIHAQSDAIKMGYDHKLVKVLWRKREV